MSVLRFGAGIDQPAELDRKLWGSKGVNLAQIAKLVSVPPGFIISSAARKDFELTQELALSAKLQLEIKGELSFLEQKLDLELGNKLKPLFLAVRSGAEVSLPGVLASFINIGSNEEVISVLADQFDQNFAYRLYANLLRYFGQVVVDIPVDKFLEFDLKFNQRVGSDVFRSQKEAAALLGFLFNETGYIFPQRVEKQLEVAIAHVYQSWDSKSAQQYRALKGLSDDNGTAVIIQQVVFGNYNSKSASGVVVTRNLITGEPLIQGEVLFQQQGLRLVSGEINPEPLVALRDRLPEVYRELAQVCRLVEGFLNNVQEIEFVVENEKLWILQTRRAVLTDLAKQRINQDLQSESTVYLACDSTLPATITNPSGIPLPELSGGVFSPKLMARQVGRGLGASAGIVTGVLAFNQAELKAWKKLNRVVILVRPQTSIDDFSLINQADGLLTMKGGITSHASVIARDLGKPTVVGLGGQIRRDGGLYCLWLDSGFKVWSGNYLQIDGLTGEVCHPFQLPQRDKMSELGLVPKLDGQDLGVDLAELDLSIVVAQSCDILAALTTFYTVEAMIQVVDQSVEDRAYLVFYRDSFNQKLAAYLVSYLLVAIISELGYLEVATEVEAGSREHDFKETALKQLISYNLDQSSPQTLSQLEVLWHLDDHKALSLLKLAQAIFSELTWTESYGGRRWAKITQVLLGFLDGQFSKVVFIDTVFNLQHNSGLLFDKFPSVKRGVNCKAELDHKRDAPDLKSLVDRWSKTKYGLDPGCVYLLEHFFGYDLIRREDVFGVVDLDSNLGEILHRINCKDQGAKFHFE